MHLLLNCTRAFRCEDCTTSARPPHLERLATREAPLCVLPQREIRVARLGKETIFLQFTMMEPASRTLGGFFGGSGRWIQRHTVEQLQSA